MQKNIISPCFHPFIANFDPIFGKHAIFGMGDFFLHGKYTILAFYRPQKCQNMPEKQRFKVFWNFPKSKYFWIFTCLICLVKLSPQMVGLTPTLSQLKNYGCRNSKNINFLLAFCVCTFIKLHLDSLGLKMANFHGFQPPTPSGKAFMGGSGWSLPLKPISIMDLASCVQMNP